MNEAKIQLRLPEKVRNWLSEVAKQNDRSMNGQMVAILKERMAGTSEVAKNAN